MFEEITKEFIRTHKFSAKVPPVEHAARSFRLCPNKKLPPMPDDLQAELRKNFSVIMATTFKSDYVLAENNCYISAAAMRKYLNGSRPITRFAVAKICIGARLSLEKTCELFKLCGHILSPNDFILDAIVVDTLNCKETIEDFYTETKKFGFDDLWKKWDKLS